MTQNSILYSEYSMYVLCLPMVYSIKQWQYTIGIGGNRSNKKKVGKSSQKRANVHMCVVYHQQHMFNMDQIYFQQRVKTATQFVYFLNLVVDKLSFLKVSYSCGPLDMKFEHPVFRSLKQGFVEDSFKYTSMS